MSETSAAVAPPPTEPTASPPEAPKAAEREISPTKRGAEVAKLAIHIVKTMAKAIQESGTPPTENQQVILGVSAVAEGIVPPEDTNWDEHPIFITREKNGTPVRYRLTGIKGASEGKFVSELTPVNGGAIEEENIPFQEISDQSLLSEGDRALAEASGDEAEILRLHLAQLRDPEEQPGPAADGLIKKEAAKAGVLTFDDFAEFVKSVETQGATLPPQLQAENAKMVQALNEIKLSMGGNLMDFENFRKIFIAGGYSKEKYEGQIKGAEEAVDEARKAFEKDPKNLNLQQNLVDKRLNVFLLQQMTTALDEGGLLHQQFTKMDKGEIPQEQAKKFVEMFRKGDLEGIINESASKDLPEEKKEELRKALLDIAKKGGLVSLFLMIILGTGAGNFKGVVSLDQR